MITPDPIAPKPPCYRFYWFAAGFIIGGGLALVAMAIANIKVIFLK